ncbi:putative tail component [Cellulophaga phage phi10:1]|uniref:Putative tail component n=1 Tax=Cellulophaga phage phi10:1 TaxID=1327981 RepID=S0A2I3_9CAUD|nr:putative tail component [Cellulophaga phage phi10:1]AGO48423.1 putative tail component [Cellulophaga phage phi10:1]
MENVKGLSKLIKDLSKLGDAVDKKVSATVEASARELASDAEQLAPRDLGDLRQSIRPQEITKKTWKVYANFTGLAPYAAYIEFGTGGKVSVPSELADMADKFRGKGLKKIDLRPQPYLYPAFVKQRTVFFDDLKALLVAELKKV